MEFKVTEFKITERLLFKDPVAVQNILECYLRASFDRIERYSGQLLLFSDQHPQDVTGVDTYLERGNTTILAFGTYPAGPSADREHMEAVKGSLEAALDQTLDELKIERAQPREVRYIDFGYQKKKPPEATLPAPVPVEPPLDNFVRPDAAQNRSRKLWVAAGAGLAVTAAALTVVGIRLLEPAAHTPAPVENNASGQAAPQPGVPPTPRVPAAMSAPAATSVPAAPSAPAATSAPAASPYVLDAQVAVKPEADLTTWVQDWAESLRSRDPQSQGSYYLTTVDDYLGAKGVSRACVIQEKMASLRQRERLSTVKVEQVHIDKQDDSDAVVHAIKHTISETPGGGVSETFVRTRLKLRKILGVWQIVEEQDLGDPRVINPNITN
jgi:hypothetical protein